MGMPSLDQHYFANVYAQTADPWNFATSPYERAKYAATIAALGDRRFRNAFEIGCSIGVLTELLAERCTALLAIDINERALATARERCADRPNVRFEQMTFPHAVPVDTFDLILISEVAYYWSDDDLATAIDYVARTASGGMLELVHFLPKVEDYVRDGDAVHAAFLTDPRFTPIVQSRADSYRIDVLRVA